MNLRILVVDDFDTMVRIIRNILHDIGYNHVFSARNGEQACQVLNKEKIDLIISDWVMPRMNGLELLKKVKSTPEWAHIPFMMVTAEAEKEHIVEAIQNKADGYIIKPFTQEALAKKIVLALGRK